MKYKFYVAIMIFFSFVAEAKWSCTSSFDKMDNTHIYGCSTDNINSYTTLRGKPYLYIRTRNDNLDVYVTANEYVGNVDNIEVKFDNDEKKTYSVSQSTDKLALFVRDSLEFVQSMQKHKKILIRYTPYNESPVTVEFDSRGLNTASKSFKNQINKLIDIEKMDIEKKIQEKKEREIYLKQKIIDAEQREKEIEEREKLNQQRE